MSLHTDVPAATRSVAVGGATPADRIRRSMRREPVLWSLPVLLLAAVVIGAVASSDFLTGANASAILRASAITGTAAVGMSLVTLSGSFVSMSLQQTAMLSAVAFAYSMNAGSSASVSLTVAVAACVLVCLLEGGFVALGLNSIVTTLAVGTMVFGAVSWVMADRLGSITFASSAFGWLTSRVFGIPVQVIVFAIVTAVLTIGVRRTVFGRELVLVGANRDAAHLSGINIKRVVVLSFVGLGLTTAIAGIMAAAVLQQATPTMLPTLTTDVITAVLVGGIAIGGGNGSPIQAAFGAVFISTVSNVMVLAGLSEGQRQAVEGALLLCAVIVLHLVQRRGKR